jgi:hypothetical protein
MVLLLVELGLLRKQMHIQIISKFCVRDACMLKYAYAVMENLDISQVKGKEHTCGKTNFRNVTKERQHDKCKET